MFWLIAGLFLLSVVVSYIWMIRPNMPRRSMAEFEPYDYAHRGLWDTNEPGVKNRPENSLAAFRAAVEKGYGMELDVHLTADGHLVVHHDDSLQRLTGVDIRISQSTLQQIRACHLPNGEPVPTFDEVLQTVHGAYPLIVEIKTEGHKAGDICRAVYELMQRYNGLWCMESFEPDAVAWFRLNAPEVLRGQLAFNHAGKGKTWKLWWRNIGIASMAQNVIARPDFMALDYKSEKLWWLPSLMLRWMRPTFVAWTVRSQQDMDALRGRYDIQIFEKFEAQRQ